MVILGLIGTGSLQSLDRRVRERIVDGLETVLATTHQVLVLWLEQRQNTIGETASRNEVREATSTLLDGGKRAIDLRKSPAQTELRAFFAPLQERFGDLGFFIIDAGGMTLASDRDANLGTRNLIALERVDLLDRAFESETVFVTPIPSDVPIPTAGGGDPAARYPTMFIATPVLEDDGNVMAVLAVRIAVHELSRITRLGEIVETGETYAFDAEGRLATSSRFENALFEAGVLERGQTSISTIVIRDPGGNRHRRVQGGAATWGATAHGDGRVSNRRRNRLGSP
jgi:hypothetical protein